jgi:hypothetical protein
MKRRAFLKTTVATSLLGSLGSASFLARAAEREGLSGREFYELRAYRFKPESNHDLLDAYLEKALIPGLNRLGIKPVGVFTQMEAKEEPPVVYVLIPYPSLDSYATATLRLNIDPEYQRAGAEYLQTPKANPAFLRVDSWFMLAFAGMPKIELPAYCKEKKPRIFELRTYESHSEVKALNKVEMFNAGEIGAMRETGLGPIFYGQTLIGSDLPHLMYMTSGENREVHKEHWSAFGKHPTWQKLKADPQYKDNMTKATPRFLVPLACSQI